jgi:1-acyl-sn-glycerol-3-phosphate acyltransferase
MALRAAGPAEDERWGRPQATGPGEHAAGTAADLSAALPEGKARQGANATAAAVRDRSVASWLWYRSVQHLLATLAAVVLRWRATGQRNIPASGGVLLVCNHVSFLDVVILGIPLRRQLNYVARSTLFVPVLGQLIRSLGGFAIQREGVGASGMKETLRRLRAGGIVALFPEGTRTRDGQLGPLKPGIAALAARVGVPVVPAGLAGMFEVWPRTHVLPVPHPVRIHYGPPIRPDELVGLDTESITALIRARMSECQREAGRALQGDLTY